MLQARINPSKLVSTEYSKGKIALFLLGIFIASALIQGFSWREFDMSDSGLWGDEAHYVQTQDSRAFDFLGAYGHPGGPIIEGTVILHVLFGIPYNRAVLVFVTLANSLIIAGICALIFILRKKSFWWIAAFGTLTLNRLYDFATPPTAVASVLIVLLCLLTFYLLEQNQKTVGLLLWGSIAGFFVATRADIGLFSSACFLLLLLPEIGWYQTLRTVGIALFVFVLCDPFMWSMPLQHIEDILYKIFFHYAEYTPTHFTFIAFMTAALLSLVSVSLGLVFLVQNKISSPLSVRLLRMLLFMTAVLSVIFFSSQYQAIRYFVPLFFIWETVLPLFLFTYIDALTFSFTKSPQGAFLIRKSMKWFVILLIYFYHLASLVLAYLFARAYHVLPV